MSEFYVLFDALDFVLIRKKHEILSNSCSYFFCPFFFNGPIIFLGNLNVFMERSILFFTVPLFVILLIPRQGSDIVNLVSRISHRSKRGRKRDPGYEVNATFIIYPQDLLVKDLIQEVKQTVQ